MVDTVALLDIDGVLNEPQQPVTFCMQQKLQQLARHKEVYFVTGNTYTKSVDLLNGPIGMYSGIFCLNADELRTMRGKLIWQDEVTEPLTGYLQQYLNNYFSGDDWCWNNNIEWRSPRFVNFSQLGRYCTQDDRDCHEHSWREDFIAVAREWALRGQHAIPEFSIGGQVSIDIYSKGADKSRAAKWINNTGRNFVFIGDKTAPDGNDHCVKLYCDNSSQNKCLTSSGPLHTMEMLDNLIGN